jgi:hypothetical protein
VTLSHFVETELIITRIGALRGKSVGEWIDFPTWFASTVYCGTREKHDVPEVNLMKTPEVNGWRRDENSKAWIISVVVAGLITILFYRIAHINPATLMLVFIVLTIILFQFVGFRPRRLEKMYSLPLEKVDEVIVTVLDEKGLPYEMGDGRYYLTGTNLSLEAFNYEHKGLPGVLVCFVPYTGNNIPLIMSLSAHLDEALSEY